MFRAMLTLTWRAWRACSQGAGRRARGHPERIPPLPHQCLTETPPVMIMMLIVMMIILIRLRLGVGRLGPGQQNHLVISKTAHRIRALGLR